ncbi:MAG TPA: aminotransferase class V-fold PLP-dependent enzyme [Microbacterium sp.]|uniref:cysteine desulfurase family protein n=1 Tax=Microbacterium sp. TaxID=51671 RepID=UPI002B997B93|nr:aminotransferase class V-fold PLP-dependent enzyme [Microbacterium sp.]HWI32385.1 aminotransferase class V-fold PLP-dependent enzyme [Microbacterium sp.]
MEVYLDHAATTPLRSEAREAWIEASGAVGNASSIHGGGQSARRLLEESRERIAAVLQCDAIELLLTSGGTESINLALKGLWWSRGARGDGVVLPDGEHHATLDTVHWLATHDAARVVPVGVDRDARIDPSAFGAAMEGPGIAFGTALAANNETGSLNDCGALSAAAAGAGVPLHLDAVAALGHIPVRFAALRGDAVGAAGLVALSVSAHKIGGPVGVGGLVVSRSAAVTPLLHGGGQQRALRAGTQDVAGAAAFAVAAELAEAEREAESARLAGLRDRLVRGILDVVPGAELLGHPVERLPGNAHILFPGAAGESLLFLLDREGIAVSTGSACQAGVPEPSHVVIAMGRSEQDARSVLRFTLGRTSGDADVDAVVAAMPEAYARASRRA